MKEIFTAKTVDEAKQEAVNHFGIDESLITFEILEEPKKGLFKMKGEAKVSAEYNAPTKAEIAQNYIKNILDKMGVNSESTITENEDSAILNFDADGTGTIIGRRGETLDALQYLASMVANKKDEKDYYRIILDSCDYRNKRKKTLEELADKISKSVVKSGHSAALEPMNPYERRIIHSKVSEIEGVYSKSSGEEPHRKVIIYPVNKKPDKPKTRNFNNNKKKNYDGGGNIRSLDLKTSFEKDYKKPKPEDGINTGLYGKIKF